MKKFRLIVSSVQPELVAAIKTNLQGKPMIEMVIFVNTPGEAENKLSRQDVNVILADIDGFAPNADRIRAFETRYELLILYTSVTITRSKFSGRKGDDFILKPADFNSFASVSFAANLIKRMEGFVKRQAPLVTRDLGKLVSDNSGKKIVAVASSTGGTNALEAIFKQLPGDCPPMVVVQHMPSGFTKLFADRLNATYKQEIKEAETGDYLKQGQVLLAPADRHMRLIRQQGRFAVECFIGAKMHGVMPAADVLFETVAELCKANAVGVVLTGMGSDGARGLMKMHNAGAKTIGQDEKSSVVYGMPKVAKGLGAVDFELDLSKIAEKIISLA